MALRRKKKKYPKNRVYIGVISKPHGLQGEVKMKLFGSTPALVEQLGVFNVNDSGAVLELDYIRGSANTPIYKFSGVDSRDASEALIGAELWVHESALPELEDDAIYESDLLYCQAQSPEGDNLGRIDSIIETGECDVLVIRNSDGKELMVPALKEVVKEIRKDESLVIIKPLEEDQ